MTAYLQHVEIKPREWARIWAETALQRPPWPPRRPTAEEVADQIRALGFSAKRVKDLYESGVISRSAYTLAAPQTRKRKKR
jgi:hypothetical protein